MVRHVYPNPKRFSLIFDAQGNYQIYIFPKIYGYYQTALVDYEMDSFKLWLKESWGDYKPFFQAIIERDPDERFRAFIEAKYDTSPALSGEKR